MLAARAERRKGHCSEAKNKLEEMEASLQLSNIILARLARQENLLLESVEGRETIKKRQGLRSETSEALSTIRQQ